MTETRERWDLHIFREHDHLQEFAELQGTEVRTILAYGPNPRLQQYAQNNRTNEEPARALPVYKPTDYGFRATDSIYLPVRGHTATPLNTGQANCFEGKIPPFRIVLRLKPSAILDAPGAQPTTGPAPLDAGLTFYVRRLGDPEDEPDPMLQTFFSSPSRLKPGETFSCGIFWQGKPQEYEITRDVTSQDFFAEGVARLRVNVLRCGNFLRVECAFATGTHPDFRPPSLVEIDTFRRVFELDCHLPRARDVSDAVIKRLQRVPWKSLMGDERVGSADPPDGLTRPNDAHVKPDDPSAYRLDIASMQGKRPEASFPFLAEGPIEEATGRIVRAPTPMADFDSRAIELKMFRKDGPGGHVAPRVVGVAWPKRCYPRDTRATPGLTFHLHFNSPGWWTWPDYPTEGVAPENWSWDHLYFTLWQYMNYVAHPTRPGRREDPTVPATRKRLVLPGGADPQEPLLRHLAKRTGKGLQWQLAASGAPVVLVVPMLGRTGVTGADGLFDGNRLELVLKEIQGVIQRAEPNDPTFDIRPIQSVAVSAFSGGVISAEKLLRLALDDTRAPPLVGSTSGFLAKGLREVVLLDPAWVQTFQYVYPDGTPAGTVTHRPGVEALELALKWRKPGDGRSVRIYTQSFGTDPRTRSYCEQLIGRSLPPSDPQKDKAWIRHSDGGEVTVAFIPFSAWWQAIREAIPTREDPKKYGYDQDTDRAHQMIPTFCLLDALRRSKV